MCDSVDSMHERERSLLKKSALRATPKRVALLALLKRTQKPLTAEDIHKTMQDIDLVTVYRNLQSLVTVVLVREVRFKDASVRYEFASSAHHHHLVCTNCGTVDELPECDVRSLEKHALEASSRFKLINEHSLEFFGTCRACA